MGTPLHTIGNEKWLLSIFRLLEICPKGFHPLVGLLLLRVVCSVPETAILNFLWQVLLRVEMLRIVVGIDVAVVVSEACH